MRNSVFATVVIALCFGVVACSDQTPGGSGTGGAGGSGGGEQTGDGVQCRDELDCEVWFGVAPCGIWSCDLGICAVECLDCEDEDRDGYGVGAGCAGPDCDDTTGAVGADGWRACYDGPADSEGIGTCQPGTEACVDGAWSGTCDGGTIPGTELCNGLDDDCNGTADDADASTDCTTQLGVSPCGAWSCNVGLCEVSCPDCVDEDRDGFGTGGGCAGVDCDDNDPAIGSDASRDCYTGIASTEGVGECVGGSEVCTAGTWGGCLTEVTPVAELCNGLDDDCDGIVDGVAAADSDCVASNPTAACGAWQCLAGACAVSCPGCDNDADHDGYGPDAGCAGPDCDDNDNTIYDSHVGPCYSGLPATEGVGTCRTGTETCIDGGWSPCVGEVPPSAEACNGEDDDCDTATDEDLGSIICDIGACQTTIAACEAGGQFGICPPAGTGAAADDSVCNGIDDDCDGRVDEDCSSNCVWVFKAPAICGISGDGSTAAPFGCIQDAIDAASPGETVCVTATGCGRTGYPESPVMRDGVNVIGNYNSDMSGSRCSNSLVDFRAVIEIPPLYFGSGSPIPSPRATGVYFGPTISSPTLIEGFEIVRANAFESSGITVDGATGVLVTNVWISGDTHPNVAYSWGVNLINGGEAEISSSQIWGGMGAVQAIAVRSKGGKPFIHDNCGVIDVDGRCINAGCNNWCCTPSCSGQTNVPGLFSRYWDNSTARPAESYTVYLEDSPGAVIDRSAVTWADGMMAAAIRILGDATGTVIRGSRANSWANYNSYGIWMTDCDGAAPWIVDNGDIMAEGYNPQADVEGIRAVGDCHPVIDGNRIIRGGSEGGAARPSGVHCGADNTGASRCVIVNNHRIQSAAWGYPAVSTGVRCDDGACLRIAGNLIRGADTGGNVPWCSSACPSGGREIYGLWLQNSGTFVDNNEIIGGCGIEPNPSLTGASATGVYAKNSYARLQNNRIFGGHCGGTATPGPLVVGMHIEVEDGPSEIDVHSNYITGDGDAVACTSIGLLLSSGASAPSTPKGIYRNNIIEAGPRCTNDRFNVFEWDCLADPRLFENNDLDAAPVGGTAPVALYFNNVDCSGTTQEWVTAAEVNAMSGAEGSFSNNIDAPATYSSSLGFPFLEDDTVSGVSPLDGAGTPEGAPAHDMDGDPRSPTTPDIGPDECVTNGCQP